ncbi:MAG TPA: hypothetical protein VGQ83_42830 [Polyangia bacterium]|jgi:hypothetical protein
MWYQAGIGWTGSPVNAAAYSQSPASTLEDEWLASHCGQHLSDPICPNGVTCTNGQCEAVAMQPCGPWDCQHQCPTNQYCNADGALALGGSCSSFSYASLCVATCAPESVCGNFCCGPGLTCRSPGCCVFVTDAGVGDAGPGDAGGGAPPDAPTD